ncbi:pyrrolysine--tRNA(Pyl) ligase large subunit [Chloroflexota bacterium]
MTIQLTEIQKQRLWELNADIDLEKKVFSDAQERNASFKIWERKLVEEEKQRLRNLRNYRYRPLICEIERILIDKLTEEGFVQVFTPIILAKGSLEKMSITAENPLINQVFWVGKSKCLRPMLAPNLYYLLKRLVRLWEKPIRIFEVGPCFRKESKGSHHSNEFTMLNLVELGLPEESRAGRLNELVTLLMKAIGISGYRLVLKPCVVYGETLDIMTDIELGSAAMGPHPLDDAWGIVNPWVGLGLGLERLVMAKEGYRNIQRTGRSLIYLDGVRLNI